MDNRAVSPVIGKLLAAGLAVLYIATMSGMLLGGVVPEYQNAAGDELAERVLATVTGQIERAVPETDATTDVTVTLDLPASIRNEQYQLLTRNGSLVLEHPDETLDTRAEIELPSRVHTENQTWASGGKLAISVTGAGTNRTVTLREGES